MGAWVGRSTQWRYVGFISLPDKAWLKFACAAALLLLLVNDPPRLLLKAK